MVYAAVVIILDYSLI